MDIVPRGITVVDVEDDVWAYWQVSISSFNGPPRAVNTNAVVSTGFDKRSFESLAWQRPVLLSHRVLAGYDNHALLDANQADMDLLLEQSYDWVNYLDGLFWAENQRRVDHNQRQVVHRKAARKRGETVPKKYERLGALQEISWPAPPSRNLWDTAQKSSAGPKEEAMRLAEACVRLLDYWLDIESERTKKTRKYFSETGGVDIRRWPEPTPIGGTK